MNNASAQHTLARQRAQHELQLQVGFTLRDTSGAFARIVPAEFVDELQWAKFAAQKPLILLSAARSEVLGMGHAPLAASTDNLSWQQLMVLVAGGKKEIDFTIQKNPAPAYTSELIALAKQAAILPALLYFPVTEPEGLVLDAQALADEAPVEMLRGETVMLPLENAERSTLTSFRTRYGTSVHLALIIGEMSSKTPPLVRVHSSCVTGDLLGSLRCDCGDQLQLALAQMKEQGAGILLYLHQEGRGIGITSKLRAYALQEHGLDTFAANRQLGFEEDERDFSIAGEMLKMLGATKIRLLTNNPEKLESFANAGITITERLPLTIAPNAHNHAYLEAKKIQRGHL